MNTLRNPIGAARLGVSLPVVAFLAGSCFAPSASAAEDDLFELAPFVVSTDNDKGYLAGNSVSATRIDTQIKDLPFSVNAFTDQFIDDTAARDLFDIVSYAPSVTSSGREFTAGNTRFTIRGFDQLSPQRNGFDGDRYVDTVNISRVEVVKGPASLLYGQIAPGGTVNYITKRPLPAKHLIVKQDVGTDSYLRSEVDANVPLSDQLKFRLNLGWENAFETLVNDSSETLVIAPSLLWSPSKRFELLVDYQNFGRDEEAPVSMMPNMQLDLRRDADPALNGAADGARDGAGIDYGFLGHFPLPKDFNYSGNGDYRTSDMQSLNVEAFFSISPNLSGRFNYNYNDYEVDHKLTGVGSVVLTPPTGVTYTDFAAQILANPLRGLDAATATLQRRKRLIQEEGSSEAMQLEFTGRVFFEQGVLKPVVGIYRREGEGGTLRRQGNGSPGSTPNNQTTPSQRFQDWNMLVPSTWDYVTDYDPFAKSIDQDLASEDEDFAVYATGNLQLMDEKLNIVAGLRYNKTESDDLRDATDDFSASKTTPQFGIGYKVDEALMVYASYSESFTISERFLQDRGVRTGAAAPVKGEGVELGIKTSFLDGRVSSTLALFEIKQTDRVLRYNEIAPGGSIETTTFQGTEDKSEGVELELNYAPTENWQIYVSAALNDIKVTKAPPPLDTAPINPSDPLAGNAVYRAAFTQAYRDAILSVVGSTPEGAVEKLFNIWTRYDFSEGSLDGFWIGGGLQYTGEKAQRLNNPLLFLEAETLINLSAGYDFKIKETPVSALLSWKNVTDEEYFPANQQRGLPERIILSFKASF